MTSRDLRLARSLDLYVLDTYFNDLVGENGNYTENNISNSISSPQHYYSMNLSTESINKITNHKINILRFTAVILEPLNKRLVEAHVRFENRRESNKRKHG